MSDGATHVVNVSMSVRVVGRDARQINLFREVLHSVLEAGRETFQDVLVEDPHVTVFDLAHPDGDC